VEEVLARFGIGNEAGRYEEDMREMLKCGGWDSDGEEEGEGEGRTRPPERFWCELSRREMDKLGGKVLLCSNVSSESHPPFLSAPSFYASTYSSSSSPFSARLSPTAQRVRRPPVSSRLFLELTLIPLFFCARRLSRSKEELEETQAHLLQADLD